MTPNPSAGRLRHTVLEAVQCAVTLVVILAVVGMIAWAAGLASLADLPWVLTGVFAGSFVAAIVRRTAR